MTLSNEELEEIAVAEFLLPLLGQTITTTDIVLFVVDPKELITELTQLIADKVAEAENNLLNELNEIQIHHPMQLGTEIIKRLQHPTKPESEEK